MTRISTDLWIAVILTVFFSIAYHFWHDDWYKIMANTFGGAVAMGLRAHATTNSQNSEGRAAQSTEQAR